MGMSTARKHTELTVWKLSAEIRAEVIRLIARPGFKRDPDLRTQLRRAVNRLGPNIAEGFARFKPRDFARFMRVVRGSLRSGSSIGRSAQARD